MLGWLRLACLCILLVATSASEFDPACKPTTEWLQRARETVSRCETTDPDDFPVHITEVVMRYLSRSRNREDVLQWLKLNGKALDKVTCEIVRDTALDAIVYEAQQTGCHTMDDRIDDYLRRFLVIHDETAAIMEEYPHQPGPGGLPMSRDAYDVEDKVDALRLAIEYRCGEFRDGKLPRLISEHHELMNKGKIDLELAVSAIHEYLLIYEPMVRAMLSKCKSRDLGMSK